MPETDKPKADFRSLVSPAERRISVVVELPPRPVGLETTTDWAVPYVYEKPRGSVGFLCRVEWAWFQDHGRVDEYHFQRKRSVWQIWNHSFDEVGSTWRWQLYASADRSQDELDPIPVAAWMLIDVWRMEKKEFNLDCFHMVTSAGLFEALLMRALAREVWGKSFELDDQEND